MKIEVMPVEHYMITTAFSLEGYKVVRNLGVVRGITVRSRSIVGSFFASLQTIFGGNISILTELCEQSRTEAFQMMAEHASVRGANAIIGVRYDANEVGQGATEVLCYGTAVLVEEENETQQSSSGDVANRAAPDK
jgi:uncharacterized protein YbjQ (UPF0145 family)